LFCVSGGILSIKTKWGCAITSSGIGFKLELEQATLINDHTGPVHLSVRLRLSTGLREVIIHVQPEYCLLLRHNAKFPDHCIRWKP
jgi:hypothetical protein